MFTSKYRKHETQCAVTAKGNCLFSENLLYLLKCDKLIRHFLHTEYRSKASLSVLFKVIPSLFGHG